MVIQLFNFIGLSIAQCFFFYRIFLPTGQTDLSTFVNLFYCMSADLRVLSLLFNTNEFRKITITETHQPCAPGKLVMYPIKTVRMIQTGPIFTLGTVLIQNAQKYNGFNLNVNECASSLLSCGLGSTSSA